MDTTNTLTRKALATARKAERLIVALRTTGAGYDVALRAIDATERAYDRARGECADIAACDALYASTVQGQRGRLTAARDVASALRAERASVRLESLPSASSTGYVPGIGYVQNGRVIG